MNAMTPLGILRDYQLEAIDHLWKSWDAGMTRVPMVLATGLGKTKIFTRVVWKWLQENPGKRVLVIAHTDELISQAVAEMSAANQGTRVGIVKGVKFNDVSAPIIISSRQTLQSLKRREQIKRVGLIVIDEAHHAVRENTYGVILDHFGAYDIDPRCVVAGFTATLSRGDKSKLSALWEAKPDKFDNEKYGWGTWEGTFKRMEGYAIMRCSQSRELRREDVALLWRQGW